MLLSKFLTIFRPEKALPRHSYDSYIRYTFLSNMVASMQLSLSTHSMLSCIGECSNGVIASSNYLGKDVMGQLGSLWYIHRSAKNNDTKPRKQLQKSLIFQQIAILTETSTALLPTSLFLPLAGGGNILQNISFIHIGAINAKIIQRLHPNEIGEVYAKIAMMNTLGTSIGMMVGIGINLGLNYVTSYLSLSQQEIRILICVVLGWLRYTLYMRSITGLEEIEKRSKEEKKKD